MLDIGQAPVDVIFPRDFHFQHLAHGLRTDGRHFDELRPISISPAALSSCIRSFIVRWGGALLMGGIRAEVAACLPHTPDRGALGTSPSYFSSETDPC
jgi:exosome complex RNA-binding protein Rrp42 (RNase PH superfamily)